jgi:hypothetical protein
MSNIPDEICCQVLNLPDDLVQKIIRETEIHLAAVKRKNSNKNFAKWNSIKNNTAGMNGFVTELIRNLGYLNPEGSETSNHFNKADLRIPFKKKKTFRIQYSGNYMRLNKRINNNPVSGNPLDKHLSPFIETALKQAQKNIIKIITNYRQAL